MSRPRTRENGAVAVLVALSSVVIFGLAAMAVDLGNAYSRDRQVQTQADIMALAAGVNLPDNVTNRPAINAALDAYAAQNPIGGQVAANFTDGIRENGWVEFDDPNTIRVFSPQAWVDFGLANALGFGGTNVAAKAAVEIRSPGRGPMPFFAVQGCDFGLQSLSDGQPNSAPPPTTIPLLPDNGNSASAQVAAVSPSSVPQDGTTGVQITGTGFAGNGSGNTANDPLVKAVGFYRAVGSTPTDNVRIDVGVGSGISVTSQTSITVDAVPSTVTGVADTWYVRVLVEEGPVNGREQRWTAATLGSAFTVTSASPPPTAGWTECSADPHQGNFGTIELPRASSADAGKWVEYNMMRGLDPALTLEPYPGASPSDAECDPTDAAPTVTSTNSNDIDPLTNCINTVTGFPSAEATRGLIEGLDSFDGLLDKATSANPFGTSPAGCAPDGSTSRATTAVRRRGSGSPVSVNNDILTCFLMNDTITLGEIARPDDTFPVSAKHSVSEKIFSFSPIRVGSGVR